MKTCKKCRWWDINVLNPFLCEIIDNHNPSCVKLANGERGWCKHSPMWHETSTLHWCSYYERYATKDNIRDTVGVEHLNDYERFTEDNYKQRVWKDKMRFRMKIGQEIW